MDAEFVSETPKAMAHGQLDFASRLTRQLPAGPTTRWRHRLRYRGKLPGVDRFCSVGPPRNMLNVSVPSDEASPIHPQVSPQPWLARPGLGRHPAQTQPPGLPCDPAWEPTNRFTSASEPASTSR